MATVKGGGRRLSSWGEDVTQGGMIAEMSELWVEVEV